MSNYEIKLNNGTEAEFISVTSVLKLLDKSDALIPWALNQCESKFNHLLSDHIEGHMLIEDVEEYFKSSKYAYKEVSEEALDIGSQVHDIIEQYIKQGKDAIGDLKDEVAAGFYAFLEWEEENIEEWVSSEESVYSLRFGYAGTLDARAKFKDGRLMTVDFKTSKRIYDEYAMQIAAYDYAVEEMTGIKSDGVGVLRLDKETGIPEWKDFTKKRERSLHSFLALLQFYYLQKDRRLKNNPFVKEIKELYK